MLSEEAREDFFDLLADLIQNSIIKPVYDFVTWLGQQIWNALIFVVDKFLEGVEWFLNYIRGYLKYAIMIVIAWLGVSRAVKSDTMRLRDRILWLIFSPVAGAVTAEIFDRLVPVAVTLPRLKPILIPPEVSEEYDHEQYVNESVTIIEPLSVSEESDHEHYVNESVKILANIYVSDSFNHEHYVNESIITGALVSSSEEYDHIQYIYETVSLIAGIVIYPQYDHEQYVNESVTVA